MQFDILTIFPNIFNSYFSESILSRAQKNKLIHINVHDLRKWAIDKHKTVDDTPYGGGAGMVLKIEPIFKALMALKKAQITNYKTQTNHKSQTRIILFSAKGKVFTQADARRLAKYERIIMICGRYEGVDERVAEHLIDEEISIGEYILTGGEIPAMILTDALTRLLPGSLGNMNSAREESHKKSGYLEFPQYTKPENFRGWPVPKVLLSGHHEKIEKWRKKQSQSKAQ
jgi:tRNA (guanine37-N1)-methyltransferase